MSIKRPKGWKKIRGWKKKHRAMVKISDVSPDGFRLRTFNRDYYVSRQKHPWFKDATQRELQDVWLFPNHYDDPTKSPDHGDWLCWESLDVDLCTNIFEYPERFICTSAVRGVLRRDLFEEEQKQREEYEKTKTVQ